MKPVASKLVLSTVLLVAIVLSGCMQSKYIEEEVTAEARGALTTENALMTNSIDLNGLMSNSIDLNGIDPDMLSTEVLSALRDNGQLGANTRVLYKYLIGCALDPTQSISFSWTDSLDVVHQEVFWGGAGLAPTWRNNSINPPGRRSVSACMGARANYFGTPVSISIRGPQESLKHVSAAESDAYPEEEGAFWGDLFDGAPQLYSCHNTSNIANSRSKLRDCAAGYPVGDGTYLECGHVMILGDCDAFCDALDSTGLYRSHCNDDEIGAATNDVVTVFLPQ